MYFFADTFGWVARWLFIVVFSIALWSCATGVSIVRPPEVERFSDVGPGFVR